MDPVSQALIGALGGTPAALVLYLWVRSRGEEIKQLRTENGKLQTMLLQYAERTAGYAEVTGAAINEMKGDLRELRDR